MKNRSKILMVILPVVVCLALSPQAQAGESTFSCSKKDSDVALELKVTNNGPDAVKNGTVIYYFYTIPTMPKGSGRLALHKGEGRVRGHTATYTGTYTLDHKVKKGETFPITINADWRARLIFCGVTLNPD